ncbi:UVI-1 [Chaetomium tenue]|uniref:UVI-1 n=1 Tax=Chaetomium tenue TaxID=1854479 RepID=A0ACB7P6R7_9PEZI|nr:UVI-1 [Chaetomium globosum]
MVSLRSLVTGAVALMAAAVNAAATPQQIADSIKSITDKGAELQAPAQSITILNAPLIVIGQGPFPTLITGFNDIVSTANVLISQLPGTDPVQRRGRIPAGIARRGPDADLVFNAYREMVSVYQILLNILIGKAGLLEQIPLVGQPVATALRNVEGVVDTIAITLINLVESRARDLESEANSLDATLSLCINKYDGLGA